MKGINLLEKSALETKETRALERKITVYSVIILVSFFLLNLFIFVYSLNQQKKLKELTSLTQVKINEINSLKEREIKYHVLKEKLSFLRSIPRAKVNIPLIIEFFEQFENLGVYVDLLNISEEKINFSAQANDANALSSVFSLLVSSEEGKRLFKTVILGSLSKGRGSQYRFDMTLIPNTTQNI